MKKKIKYTFNNPFTLGITDLIKQDFGISKGPTIHLNFVATVFEL